MSVFRYVDKRGGIEYGFLSPAGAVGPGTGDIATPKYSNAFLSYSAKTKRDGQTDGRTDGRTDKHLRVTGPFSFV